jgi:hypothetical protein
MCAAQAGNYWIEYSGCGLKSPDIYDVGDQDPLQRDVRGHLAGCSWQHARFDSRRGVGPAIERHSARVAPAPKSAFGALPE